MSTYATCDHVAEVREALARHPQTPCVDQAGRMLRFAESELEKGRKRIALDKLRRALSWLESPVEEEAA